MAEEQDPLVGTTIRDYVLVRILGKGAMGMVYLVRRTQTNQEFAIKFLSGELTAKKEFITRFVNEAASCAALDHENIIRVFEAGQDDGMYFMVMEFVDGVDLAHFLDVQDKVKEAQSLPWLKQTAHALQYAHSRGIVHRDIKPENIMLTHDGKVKIADLGLSKNLVADKDFSMTMSGTVIGTPYYISPEQARDAKRVDARSDMYSLGATFYHLLTGVPPFQGNSAAEVMAKHMNESLVSPQRKNVALSDGVSDLIMKMMEKDPAKRFQSMDELAKAVGRLERGEPVIEHKVRLRRTETAETAPPPERSTASALQSHWLIAAGAAALLVALFLWMVSRNPAAPKATTNLPGSNPSELTHNAKSPPAHGNTDVEPPAGNNPLPQTTPEGSAQTNKSPDQTGVASTTSPPPGSTTSNPVEPAPDDGSMVVKGTSSPMPQLEKPDAFNWLDLFGILAVLIGVGAARQIGWIWGTFRAAAVWVAVVLICVFLGDAAGWLRDSLSIPEGGAWPAAFCVLSVGLILPAWMATHRLRGHEKETWKVRLNRTIAIAPGLVLGAAFATWMMSLLAVTCPPSIPITGSWIGSRIVHYFPAIAQAVEQAAKAATPKPTKWGT
ncbi:MAG: protein kinase [Verrucomicrobia bacterium]|nr:protein kinase [Verrucomicrobiota bacterium]